MSEKNEITLIMKRNDPTASKLRIMRKKGGKHSRHRMSQTGVEVVQNYFRMMRRRFAVTLKNFQIFKEAEKNFKNITAVLKNPILHPIPPKLLRIISFNPNSLLLYL